MSLKCHKIIVFYVKQTQYCKHPLYLIYEDLAVFFLKNRSTAYNVIPLITLYFRDKWENVITRFHCIFYCANVNNIICFAFNS